MMNTVQTRQRKFKSGGLRKDLNKKKTNKNLYLFSKRFFDICVSLLVIVLVLSWLIPILAILIKLDSRGPVFFTQYRVGFLSFNFKCIKLRTMVVNNDSDSKQAVNNDPRITGLGKFLRLTSLDELPQFFNVLKGEMSIVGPRPFMHSDDLAFSEKVSNYEIRYYAKPGITGMAQVKGYRGPSVSFHSIFHRYQWDAFYIRNACHSLDFKIIRLTIYQIFRSIFSFRFKRPAAMELDLNRNNLYLDSIQ
jgi:putative colanic acid biosysnthesis UDP-glucose lipid carrier transferase